MSQNGKGDAPRPLSVSAEEFARRWERALGGRVDAFCGVCGFQRATDPACETCGGTGRLLEAKEAA